jgi:hypothetical protein
VLPDCSHLIMAMSVVAPYVLQGLSDAPATCSFYADPGNVSRTAQLTGSMRGFLLATTLCPAIASRLLNQAPACGLAWLQSGNGYTGCEADAKNSTLQG